jgi:hypothetical protein
LLTHNINMNIGKAIGTPNNTKNSIIGILYAHTNKLINIKSIDNIVYIVLFNFIYTWNSSR